MKLIRLRQSIKHITPTRREITDEYTFLNDAEKPGNIILIQAYAYRPGLHIFDSDDSELALYTNDVVKEYLQGRDDEFSKSLLRSIESHEKYIQWIVLPEGRHIRSNEARVLRFVYTDGEDAYVGQTWSIFSISVFQISKTVMPADTYVSLFSVTPPPGFEIGTSKRTVEELTPGGKVPIGEEQRYHETIGEEILEFAPPVRPNPVYFETRYAVLPDRLESRLLRSFYYGLTLVSVLSIFSLSFFQPSQITVQVAGAYSALSAAVIGVCIGFIGLVTNPLTHRMKLAMTIPIVISVLTAILANARL